MTTLIWGCAQEVAAAVDKGVNETLALVLLLWSKDGVEDLAGGTVHGVVKPAPADLHNHEHSRRGRRREPGKAADGDDGEKEEPGGHAEAGQEPSSEKDLGGQGEDVHQEIDRGQVGHSV